MNTAFKSYNPDVLNCLANLSSDEVFTSPKLANDMLDMLPKELWTNPEAKFLDPVSKSGIFLREITKRLIDGLQVVIPDLQQRIDHVLTKQVFGIAITELTSMMSRRTLYCSKHANGEYSICTALDTEEGNIKYENIKHSWGKDGKCKFCGASSDLYERGEELEYHAYQFIHTEKPEKIYKNMKFDVIIGNPPYQLNDGGGVGSSAMPIYQKFIKQSIKLKPSYLAMIIPSRWFTGGRGLEEFRNEMLTDKRMKVIHDFLDASECFPNIQLKGGVCYFLWDKSYSGDCSIWTHNKGKLLSSTLRPLLENGTSTFIRINEAIPILRKIRNDSFKSFSSIISANDPFGFDIRVKNSYKRVKPTFKLKKTDSSIEFYYNGWRDKGVGYINESYVSKNSDWISDYKVLIPKAWGVGSVMSDKLNPFITEPNSCCTETYLVIGPFSSKKVCENVIAYTQTKFFHFLVSLIKLTQNSMKKVYSFVPLLDFSKKWTDSELYKKYKLTDIEVQFIENLVWSEL